MHNRYPSRQPLDSAHSYRRHFEHISGHATSQSRNSTNPFASAFHNNAFPHPLPLSHPSPPTKTSPPTTSPTLAFHTLLLPPAPSLPAPPLLAEHPAPHGYPHQRRQRLHERAMGARAPQHAQPREPAPVVPNASRGAGRELRAACVGGMVLWAALGRFEDTGGEDWE